MKNSLFLLCLFLGIWACNDSDKVVFDQMMSQENISFTPVAGGAVMHYTMPKNSDVFAMHVRYQDAQGMAVLKKAGYGTDSLILDGFNASQTNVPAWVSLVNRNNEESEPIEVSFDTKDSAPYSFFENVEVSSFWGGFQVIYNSPEHVSGMVHVFYEGTNPLTKESDTLLLESLPIMKGGDTLMYQLKQQAESYTIVIRTEDFRGYRVRQQVWQNVLNYEKVKMEMTTDNYIPSDGFKSVEDDEAPAGIKYLFDGDMKGEQRLQSGSGKYVYTFVAGPGAVGQPFYIDLESEKIPASIRMYAILNTGMTYPGINSRTGKPSGPLGAVWQARYHCRIPNEVSVYAGNDLNGDESSWTRIGYFYEAPDLPMSERWTDRIHHIQSDVVYNNMEAMNAAEPEYLEVLFPVQPTRYRYLKVVVEDTFHKYEGRGDNNEDEYVTMHELEVYVKKD